MANKKVTHEEFVQRANNIHNNQYQYIDRYVGTQTKIRILCPIHGPFMQIPYSHLAGSGCRRCDQERRARLNTMSHEAFVVKATQKHNGKYNYPEQYVHSQQLLGIECPDHGVFYQLPYTHLLGNGCKQCADFQRSGGYSQGWFDMFPDKKLAPAVLYVLQMENDSERFIKIGISTDLKNRLYWYSYIGLDYTILKIYNAPLYDVWSLEQQLLSTLNEYRYYPNVKFGGHTECLKNTPTVLDSIYETTRSELQQ